MVAKIETHDILEGEKMKIAAAGDNCIDWYDEAETGYPGGNAVNVAVYFKRLGGEASYTGAVGPDDHGTILRSALLYKGVDITHLYTLPGQTAVTHVAVKEGDRIFGAYEEGVVGDFDLQATDIDFLCDHDLVVTGCWGHLEHHLAGLKQRGLQTAYDASTDPNSPAAYLAAASTDYFFYSAQGPDGPELRKQMANIKARGPRLVIATLGESGSLVFDGTEYHQYGIVPCEAVDSLGAGDSYIAGFLKGILLDLPIIDCMALGAESASITLEYKGAW